MRLEKICRMCSSEKTRVRPIFKAYERERLLSIIKDVVHIDVCEGDGLPSNICKPCATTLIRIQGNLEEFRDNDRELRSRILGKVQELDVKGEEPSKDSVEGLNLIESNHQTPASEDPNEKPSELNEIEQVMTQHDSFSDANNDQIEHVSIAEDMVTKDELGNTSESQNQRDFEENNSNLAYELDEKIAKLTIKGIDTAHISIAEVFMTSDEPYGYGSTDNIESQNQLDYDGNNSNAAYKLDEKISEPVIKTIQAVQVSLADVFVASDEQDINGSTDNIEPQNQLNYDKNNINAPNEPDETISKPTIETFQAEPVSIADVLVTNDETDGNGSDSFTDNYESQNQLDSDENNCASDYEPDEKKSKPKFKAIRASQRQRAARATALAGGKKKRGRPPKYDDDDPNRPKMNDHKCYICRSESLGSAKALLEHLTTHLDRTPYTCTECKMETVVVKSVRSLNYHMKMHAQPMKCQYCDRRYCDERARDHHVKTYHLGESAPCPSTCNECGKVCKSVSALKTHMRDHRLSLQCEHCDKIFHRRGKLKDHISRVHEKAQKFECNLCNRVVHSLDSYNSHLKMHTSEKTYECDICPMKFYTAGNLGLHKKIHKTNANYKPHKDWSGHYTVSQEPGVDKVYTCKLCGKSYTKTVMKINNHLKNHFKDIKCDRCDLKFVNESQLKVHYVVHTGIRQHKCDYCGKDFLHKNNLTQHLKLHRNEQNYACEFCGKLFTYKEGMKAHIRNHHLRDSPYKCARCRRKFVDSASLERHITAEHEPPPPQVDLGPPPLMGTTSMPQVPNFEAIVTVFSSQ